MVMVCGAVTVRAGGVVLGIAWEVGVAVVLGAVGREVLRFVVARSGGADVFVVCAVLAGVVMSVGADSASAIAARYVFPFSFVSLVTQDWLLSFNEYGER
jgi:hypothetical protein